MRWFECVRQLPDGNWHGFGMSAASAAEVLKRLDELFGKNHGFTVKLDGEPVDIFRKKFERRGRR